MTEYNSKRDQHRLSVLDEQLAEIDDSVLSVAVKQKIREAAHLYAQWLEADDALDELGLTVSFGGGIEFPDADHPSTAVACVTIDGIKIGTVTIERGA